MILRIFSGTIIFGFIAGLIIQQIRVQPIEGNAPKLLHQAVRSGDLDEVSKLVEHGANVDEIDEKGYTPLYYAVGIGNTAITNYLIDHGASLEKQDDRGQTALWAACMYGADSDETLRILLSKNADANHINTFGANVLFQCVDPGGTSKKVRDLIEFRINANQQSFEDGDFALRIASSWGDLDTVKALLDAGANPDLQRKDGTTALMEACRGGHLEVVKILLSSRANIGLKNQDGKTAKEMVPDEKVEILKLLNK